MQIRPAEAEECESIRRVSARSCRAAYDGILDDETLIEMVEDPSFSERIREWLEETGDDDRVIYLVAVVDGDTTGEAVVGFVQVLTDERTPDRTETDEAFLKSLYVHPNHWGQGIGSQLLEAAVGRLPASVTTLSLGVLTDNDIGRSFYEKQGFEPVDTGAYEVDDVGYETTIYAKALEADDSE